MSVTSELSVVLAELDDIRERIAMLLTQAGQNDGGWSDSRAVRLRMLEDWHTRFIKQLNALQLPTQVSNAITRQAIVRSTEWNEEKQCSVPCWPYIGYRNEYDCLFMVDGELLDFPEWADWVCTLENPHVQIGMRNLGRKGWAKFQAAWEKVKRDS